MSDQESKRKRKWHRDLNLLARSIVEGATEEKFSEEEPESDEKPQKNPAAVELGRLGGLKGGKLAPKSSTPEERSEIVRKAARARWKKTDE